MRVNAAMSVKGNTVSSDQVPVGETFVLSGEVYERVNPSALAPEPAGSIVAIRLSDGRLSIVSFSQPVDLVVYHAEPGN